MHAPAGPALRVRAFDEVGEPEPVQLTAAEARRLRWLREQCRGDQQYGAWMSPTGEVYLTPTGEVHERAVAPKVRARKGDGKQASGRKVPPLIDL
jgi:hypothetical protein